MKTFLALLKTVDIRALLLSPSDNLFVQMFRYLFVGGIAFVADAGSLWGITAFGVNEYLATAIAFLLGLTVNFALSKSFVFSSETARVGGVAEFVSYGLIGVIGLLITEGLMVIGLELLSWHVMIVKVIAAAIVLVWNFAARKLLLYNHANKE